MMSDKENTIFEVCRHLKFPFLSVDRTRLMEAIEQEKTPRSHVGIPLNFSSKENAILIALLRSVYRNIELSDETIEFILSSVPFDEDLLTLRDKVETKQKIFATYEANSNFLLEEDSFWPIGYSTFISQIGNIIYAYTEIYKQKKSELPSSNEIDGLFAAEFPRMMPTQFHYAMASIGAWLGGANNIQYFATYASTPQILNGAININYALRIGYSIELADKLTKSGIIAIPASLAIPLIETQGTIEIFGSIGIEEYNLANLPAKKLLDLKRKNAPPEYGGFLLDRNYRTTFFARKLSDYALYGGKDVFRDHYEDFYEDYKNEEKLRCKHYVAPIIDVSSIEEIKSIISKIPQRDEFGLFYRGQSKLHLIHREQEIKKHLFGESCSNEPSLNTSASRINYNYDELHHSLKYFIESKILMEKPEDYHKWREKSISPICETDHAIMALSQHYGLPSHGLDITTNPEVAIWFATNKFTQNKDFAAYTKLTINEWSDNKNNWPVVCVFQTVTHSTRGSIFDCNELDEFGLKALRPERQSAHFFLGGHHDHQNRLAETLVCLLRLNPGEYNTQVDFDYLFPSPDNDPAYEFMLKFRDEWKFKDLQLEKITKFH